MKNKKIIISILIVISSVYFLSLGFYKNKWNAVNQEWFENHQLDSEWLVIQKLQNSSDGDIFKNAGLLGWYEEDGKYIEYNGQIGLQGIIFSVIDKISNLSYPDNIEIYHKIVSIFNASVLAIIILWIYLEFGFLSSGVVLLTTILSQWITLFGRNLYWVIGVYFLPFALMSILFYFRNKINNKFIYFISFIVILIKSTCGYEFISTVLVSIEIPVIYYSIKEGWSKSEFIKTFFIVGLCGLLGFATAIVINILQLSFVYGDVKGGLDALVYNIKKRTHGYSQNIDPIFKESLEAPVSLVLEKYINHGHIFVFTDIFKNAKAISFYSIKYGTIILIYSLFSSMIFMSSNYSQNINKNRKKLMALLISFIISILAPISWFVLAKGHSYIHTTINFIIWHIPFTILGFVIIGKVIECLIIDLKERYKNIYLSKSKIQ